MTFAQIVIPLQFLFEHQLFPKTGSHLRDHAPSRHGLGLRRFFLWRELSFEPTRHAARLEISALEPALGPISARW
jgi:hypothetical protein